MSPVKTVYVPRFGSQQGSSQRDEPQPNEIMDQSEPSSQCPKVKRGIKRAMSQKSRSILKVKLPKLSTRTWSKNKVTKTEDKTTGRWLLEPAASTPMTSVSQAGERHGAGTDSDAFFFSQRPTIKATDEKKKAKLTVLRTISKMLEENQFIRQRLIALSQAH